jgi:hypothetical protein
VLDTHEISECQLALAQLGLRGLGRNQAALAPQRNGHPLHQGLLQRAHGLLLPHQLRQQGVEFGPAFTRQDQVTAQYAVLGCVGAADRLARRRAGAGALERVLPVGFVAWTGRWHGIIGISLTRINGSSQVQASARVHTGIRMIGIGFQAGFQNLESAPDEASVKTSAHVATGCAFAGIGAVCASAAVRSRGGQMPRQKCWSPDVRSGANH